MSHSHSAVGHALAHPKPLKGSRMEVRASSLDYIADSFERKELFTRLAVGVSYTTVVAKHMLNNHTKQHELWLSPQYWSTSTQRHLRYFRAGFAKAYGADNIYTTPATGELVIPGRHEKSYANTAVCMVDATLPDVDKPRLREATRRGTIISCINRLDVARRNMSKGVPLDAIDADTFYNLQGMTHFLEMLQETTDIDEVRAAVNAHIALNNPSNN